MKPFAASWIGALQDQTLAGLIMWVPGSIIYLVPAFVIAVRLLSGTSVETASCGHATQCAAAVAISHDRGSGCPRLRRVAQAVMLLLAIAVMADGFLGRKSRR